MQQPESEGSESPLNKVMDPTTVESKWVSPTTEDGSMDRRGNPAVKAATGRWRSAILLLGKSYSVLYFFWKEKEKGYQTSYMFRNELCKHKQYIVGNACLLMPSDFLCSLYMVVTLLVLDTNL